MKTASLLLVVVLVCYISCSHGLSTQAEDALQRKIERAEERLEKLKARLEEMQSGDPIMALLNRLTAMLKKNGVSDEVITSVRAPVEEAVAALAAEQANAESATNAP